LIYSAAGSYFLRAPDPHLDGPVPAMPHPIMPGISNPQRPAMPQPVMPGIPDPQRPVIPYPQTPITQPQVPVIPYPQRPVTPYLQSPVPALPPLQMSYYQNQGK